MTWLVLGAIIGAYCGWRWSDKIDAAVQWVRTKLHG